MPSVRKDILENPENYFEPQVLANIQQDLENLDMDELFGMVRETSLTNLSKAQNEVGVLAGIAEQPLRATLLWSVRSQRILQRSVPLQVESSDTSLSSRAPHQ
jgi:hypothetical protein